MYSPELRMLVENILRHPEGNTWQVQGLGMLRCYLDEAKRYRLHIWDGSLKVPGVSAIHDHPWNLRSTIIAGIYKQHRYLLAESVQWGEPFNCVSIKCGEGACTISQPHTIKLLRQPLEEYLPSCEYTQEAEEIHWSIPEDGTVTLVERVVPEGKSPDHASVYWRGKGKWVNAEPRAATESELFNVTRRSLEQWF